MNVSIITINYNNAGGLKRTFDSVRSQICRDFEYIVIDGGSTDGSVDVIKENEDMIQHWVSEKDSGIYNAMNKGVSFSHGEYCLFLNSGDCLFSNHSLAKLLKKEYVEDIVSCHYILNKNGRNKWCNAPFVKPTILEMLYYNSIPHPSTLIRRELLVQKPYREDYRIISDYIFFFENLILQKASYRAVDITLSVFYDDGVSSQNPERCINEENKYFSQFIDADMLAEIKDALGEFSNFNAVDSSLPPFMSKASSFLMRLFHRYYYYIHKKFKIMLLGINR